MRRISIPLAAAAAVALLTVAHAESVAAEESLFENVAGALSRNYYDKSFRTTELPQLIDAYRTQAIASNSQDEEIQVVQALLKDVLEENIRNRAGGGETHQPHGGNLVA